MRPTANIRKLLLLETLEKQVHDCRKQIKLEMQQKGISILEREDSEIDIKIEYKFNERIKEAVYMRPMINAMTLGLLQEWMKD